MMVGEKLKNYEAEADTTVVLESAQDRIKKTMAENFAAMKPMVSPEECCFRNTDSVEQQIVKIEMGLRNQYFVKLTDVWNNDWEKLKGKKALADQMSKRSLMKKNFRSPSMMSSGLKFNSNLNFGHNVESVRQLHMRSHSNQHYVQP